MPASIRAALMNILLILPVFSYSQVDSTYEYLKQINLEKFAKDASHKIELYDDRISSKTKKTLIKLARWETKLHDLIQKADPSMASQLFSPSAVSFKKMLQQYEAGELVIHKQMASYDEYRDKLNTSLHYIQKQKDLLDSLSIDKSIRKAEDLEKGLANTDALQKMIKERKAALIQVTLKTAGKSKYLAKISKESFYYTETLRNYKEIFSDYKKSEKLAMDLLNKIPAFQKFLGENNSRASLFGSPGSSTSPANLAGLQTSAGLSAFIENRVVAGGPNAKEVFRQQMNYAQVEIRKLKEKIMKAGGGNTDTDMPDFKPNMQKTKTFKQRLEIGSNFQFGKSIGYIPSTTNIGLSIGYKVNDKSIIGLGVSYIFGIGKIEKIHFTSEGIGLRSFMDWRLRKQFFVSGGVELTHNNSFKNITTLENTDFWLQSVLIGVSKKMRVKTRFTKGTKLQVLYDFLAWQHNPVTKSIIFRIGYQL